jgi:hypothetical protein
LRKNWVEQMTSAELKFFFGFERMLGGRILKMQPEPQRSIM